MKIFKKYNYIKKLMKNYDQNYLSTLNGARIHEVSSMTIGCSADNIINPDKQVYIQ